MCLHAALLLHVFFCCRGTHPLGILSVHPLARPNAYFWAVFQLQVLFFLHFLFLSPWQPGFFSGLGGAGWEAGMQWGTMIPLHPGRAWHALGVWYWLHGRANGPHLLAALLKKQFSLAMHTLSARPSQLLSGRMRGVRSTRPWPAHPPTAPAARTAASSAPARAPAARRRRAAVAPSPAPLAPRPPGPHLVLFSG